VTLVGEAKPSDATFESAIAIAAAVAPPSSVRITKPVPDPIRHNVASMQSTARSSIGLGPTSGLSVHV
jgi:hypothetical protein